jgi:hypothetical protein
LLLEKAYADSSRRIACCSVASKAMAGTAS